MPRRGEEDIEGMQAAMQAQQDMAQLLPQAVNAAKVLVPAITAGATAGFLVVAYYFIQQDRNRPNSTTKDDTQVGIKLVLYALALTAVALAVAGGVQFLGYALGGFKGGTAVLKQALPPLLVGGGAAAVLLFVFLPKTNASTQKQPLRFFLGALAVQYAAMAIISFNGVLSGLFQDAPWSAVTSKAFASFIVNAAVGFFALLQFGKISGWTMAPPAAQYPPAAGGGGYPPQSGGYPPQQGGGGYPQQGGGGGYPQQGGGGGYPQGGGGYGGGGSGSYQPPA
jgi:uncharacterized membrane protein YgcG